MTSKEAKLLRKLKEKLTYVNIESSDITEIKFLQKKNKIMSF